MISKTLEEWSETESSDEENELVQPNRDFPISSEEENNSEEEYEDEEFNMFELAQKTLKNNSDDFFKKEVEEKKQVKTIIKLVQNDIKPTEIKKKRCFNPRLPPPNKYNNINNNKFSLNLNEFPKL